MYQRRFTVVSLLVVCVLLFSSTGGIAQTPPPRGDMPTRGGQPVYHLQTPVRAPSTNGIVSAQATALGKPGTVFGYAAQYGTNTMAYPADDQHINNPSGIVFDAQGNLFVTEEAGARLLKYDGSGNPVWQSGRAGFHFWWADNSSYAWPKDAAIAPDGTYWVANNDIATHVGTDGAVLGHFPDSPSPDADETFFRNLMGVAFDSGGHMYLSDANRNRIQIYTIPSEGEPVYEATIGETDVSGSDADHFSFPAQIAIDANDNVFVADVNNARVQRCAPTGTEWPWDWNCTTYDGSGTPGDGDNQLNSAYGIGLDAAGVLYTADSGNWRVKRCAAEQDCEVIAWENMWWPRDVAVNPVDGKIYIADQNRSVVWEYTGETAVESVYAGTLDVPYLSDNNHYNWPHGIEVDSRGSMIILEENGQRMTKLAKDGTFQWSVGTPGVDRWGDPQGVSWPRVVTTDALGKIYLGDSNGVRIFDTYGVYKTSLPVKGDDPHYQNGWITGIAVDSLGNIYVADANYHRVNVYSKTFVWLRTIGTDGECGADNQHFCAPMGIALDSARNLYVTDWVNHRVQKFDRTGRFLMSFGNGLEGEQIGRLAGPVDVAVDAKGNVYVAEENNSRVTVFSKTGAFLTMVGGWGSSNGTFMDVGGLSLDKTGKLYVTDAGNGRVQVFTPGVPYWGQVNLNGFGRRENVEIRAMAVFKNQLYASTGGWYQNGGQIYRLDRAGWTAVVDDRFENEDVQGVTALFVYQNYLYAGTNNTQIYRTQDGLSWEVVVLNEFNTDGNDLIYYPGPLTGKVCVAPQNQVNGSELWCSTSGDRGTWKRELSMSEDLDNPEAWEINAVIEYNGATYLTTNNWDWDTDTWEGAQVWRKAGTGDWQQVNEGGFGDPNASGAHSMAVFTTPLKKTYLYVATEHNHLEGKSTIFRCQTCTGSDWEEVTPANLPPNQYGVPALRVVGKTLYTVIGNMDTGLGVWASTDGATWKQVGAGGFGDSGNSLAYTNYSVTVFKNALYVGTKNENTGGEIWKFCPAAKVCR